MAKIIYASLKASKPVGEEADRRSKVVSKSVIGPDGAEMVVHVVDANSSTFGQDLRAAFSRNVAEARRANRRVLRVRSGEAPGA